MASTSASSVEKRFKYDVFLSFCGKDTRKGFVDHLYHALDHRGITIYKDNVRIEKGERIHDQLMTAIEESRYYIIVFSKNYAASSWCLKELEKIMECQKLTEHTAYPVFYDVEPTEVRHQSGAVGEAFAKLEKEDEKGSWSSVLSLYRIFLYCRRILLGQISFIQWFTRLVELEDDVGRWRKALKEAADLAGMELKNTDDGHEAAFIEKLVKGISLKLHYINLSIDDKLVGMETRVMNVLKYLESGFNDVQMIGIKGMGGGGKTTLARAVFDHMAVGFEGKSFVQNVREVTKGFGLKELQKQILSEVLNDQSIVVTSDSDGENKMKKMMPGRKVLLVLDDVDNIQQLEALAGDRKWFKPGSKIIITTRDEQVLKAHQVNFIHDVTLLSEEDAICLFSRCAFKRENPIPGYEGLSREVVSYADGLPLTIKVLGSFLCGRTEPEWVDTIKRLTTIPLKETLDILELSYNGLENDQKEIFLDIACILHGLSKKKVIRMLASCGYHAHIGLSVLEQKSLITIGDKVFMHDHLKELGMNIVRRSHPHEPKRHSRLWIKEEIEVVFVNESVNEEIKCIRLQNSNIDSAIIEKGLGKMKELRLLYVEDVYRKYEDVVSQYLPDSLQSLHWRDYPFYCLPTTFQANKLVNLQLVDSNISELWEGGEIKELNKLKFLNLRGSKVRTFDLTLTPHLEELDLGGCANFVELQFSVECLNLKFLKLSGSKVCNLNLGMTPHLEHLDLSFCHHLLELQLPVKCSNFRFLLLRYSKVSNLNLLMARHLEKLTLGAPDHFVEFHLPVECPNLKSLSMNGAKKGNLNLGMTPHLEELYLDACNEFELDMAVECPKLKCLSLKGSKVSKLDLGLTRNLERLYLKGCNYLREIHAPVGCLKRLVCYVLTKCLAFHRFEFKKKVHESTDLESVATYIIKASYVCKCLMHPECNLPRVFGFNCEYDEPGSSWSGNLEKLISSVSGLCTCKNREYLLTAICGLQHLRELTLEGSIPRDLCNIFMLKHLKSLRVTCLDLKRLPKNIRRSGCLEELCIASCKSLRGIPNNICKMKCLKRLHITFCDRLEELPEEIGCLECLEELNVTYCRSLRDIPDSICKIKSLKLLALNGCSIVKELPEEIGCLECLENLDLACCKTLREIPKSIGKMKSLKLLNLRLCLMVEELPEEIGCLECLENLNLGCCETLREIPKSICKMKSLKLLDLQHCLKVEELPEELGCLECLEELDLSYCDSLRDIPKSICKMKSLELLNLENCLKVEELPEELGCLECLEELNLGNCRSLREIPKSICNMKSLQLLNLENCLMVEELPEELGRLKCLKELRIEDSRHLPQSIYQLKFLRIVRIVRFM